MNTLSRTSSEPLTLLQFWGAVFRLGFWFCYKIAGMHLEFAFESQQHGVSQIPARQKVARLLCRITRWSCVFVFGLYFCLRSLSNPSPNARPLLLLLLLLLLFWIEELRTRCGDAGDNQATCDRGSEGRPLVSVVRQ